MLIAIYYSVIGLGKLKFVQLWCSKTGPNISIPCIKEVSYLFGSEDFILPGLKDFILPGLKMLSPFSIKSIFVKPFLTCRVKILKEILIKCEYHQCNH